MHAVKIIVDLNVAEHQFQSRFGKYGSFEELMAVESDVQRIAEFDGIARGVSFGYRFKLVVEQQRYEITAVPNASGAENHRSFYSDQSKIIRYSDEIASADRTSKIL